MLLIGNDRGLVWIDERAIIARARQMTQKVWDASRESVMSRLRDTQATVQRTAEAIAEVLKIDVEVADDSLLRVAGTGQYASRRGQVMLDGFVYRHVLDTGRTVIIENPGYHELCRPCPEYEHCSESAEMASPILLDGKPVGVIGLISFDSLQTKRLLNNKVWMLQFIAKMAELIAGNLPAASGDEGSAVSPLRIERLEKEAIVRALAETSGRARSKDHAAKLLGIGRATLYRKIKEYGITA